MGGQIPAILVLFQKCIPAPAPRGRRAVVWAASATSAARFCPAPLPPILQNEPNSARNCSGCRHLRPPLATTNWQLATPPTGNYQLTTPVQLPPKVPLSFRKYPLGIRLVSGWYPLCVRLVSGKYPLFRHNPAQSLFVTSAIPDTYGHSHLPAANSSPRLPTSPSPHLSPSPHHPPSSAFPAHLIASGFQRFDRLASIASRQIRPSTMPDEPGPLPDRLCHLFHLLIQPLQIRLVPLPPDRQPPRIPRRNRLRFPIRQLAVPGRILHVGHRDRRCLPRQIPVVKPRLARVRIDQPPARRIQDERPALLAVRVILVRPRPWA